MSCPDPDLERCKKSLRSVLLAFKDGLPMRQVSREYSNLFEEDIQFSNFKFQSLEKFLLSIPDVCTLRQRRGEVVVEGVGTKATNHIKSLVQNTGKKKGGGWAGNWREPQREALTRSSPLRESKQSPALGTRKKSPQTFIGPVKPGPESNIQLEVTNDSFKVWADRVIQILRGRPDGLTEDQVDLLYQAQYRVRLPHVWTRALTKAGLIDVDTENKVNTKPLIFPAAHSPTSVVIPAIRCPVKREWDVVITAVDSKRQEAWVTLQDGGSLKTRHQLQLQMKHCSNQRRETLQPGQYLSAWLQPDHFQRVQVVKVNRVNLTCRCFLIDQGREMEVGWGLLSDLPPGCLTVPAQAIKIRLVGFDNYTNNQFAEFVMDKLEGKRFLGRLVEGSSTSDLPELRIFDADKKSEVQFVDEAITQMKGLRLSACQEEQEPQLESQRLPEEGDFYDCKVSHVVSPDEIWVQEYSMLHHYDVMKRSAAAFYSLGNGRVVQDPQPGKVVVVRAGQHWFRAKIILKIGAFRNNKADKEFLVQLLDTGKVEKVNFSCMRSLQECFAVLPSQAFKVKLDGVKRYDQVTNMMLAEMCLGKCMVGHVTRREEDKVYLSLYDTTQDVDVNINVMLERYAKEMILV